LILVVIVIVVVLHVVVVQHHPEGVVVGITLQEKMIAVIETMIDVIVIAQEVQMVTERWKMLVIVEMKNARMVQMEKIEKV
jgi:hypothetical protein